MVTSRPHDFASATAVHRPGRPTWGIRASLTPAEADVVTAEITFLPLPIGHRTGLTWTSISIGAYQLSRQSAEGGAHVHLEATKCRPGNPRPTTASPG